MFNVLDQVAHRDYSQVFYIIKDSSISSHESLYDIVSPSGMYLREVPAKFLTFIRATPAKEKYESLAMYIIVKDTVPTGLGINACSHAGYLAAKNFKGPVVEDWEKNSFRKRTCIVSQEQFDQCIKAIDDVEGDYVLFQENDWYDEVISAAFAPRYSFPQIFKDIKLHPGKA